MGLIRQKRAELRPAHVVPGPVALSPWGTMDKITVLDGLPVTPSIKSYFIWAIIWYSRFGWNPCTSQNKQTFGFIYKVLKLFNAALCDRPTFGDKLRKKPALRPWKWSGGKLAWTVKIDFFFWANSTLFRVKLTTIHFLQGSHWTQSERSPNAGGPWCYSSCQQQRHFCSSSPDETREDVT